MSKGRQMIARHSKFEETNDNIPTPPWATRALFEYVIPDIDFSGASILEPACGAGHMAAALRERTGGQVTATDAHTYPPCPPWAADGRRVGPEYIWDYVAPRTSGGQPPELRHKAPWDYVITNPPYAVIQDFVLNAMTFDAKKGVGILGRIQFLESGTRYRSLFNRAAPSRIAIFASRIPFKQNEIIRKKKGYFTHAWFWWDLGKLSNKSEFMWIPSEAQRLLEKEEDYDDDREEQDDASLDA